MVSSGDEVLQAVTDDGLRLALHRYRPAGARRRHAVLCCHGLAANRLAFDVDPEVSLARHLASRGFEVFVLELRGHGVSQRPRWGWTFDDYVARDLPAAVAAVRRHAGCERVHWIGHSMGGLLGYAHLSRGGSDDFVSAVTVGSSLDYSDGTGFRRLAPLRPLLRRIPAVPVHLVARLSGGLVGRVTTPYERFNVWSSNCEPRHWRAICRDGFHPVSSRVMEQLATALEPGGLRTANGAERYDEGLPRATTPVLALAGSRDAQCPPRAVERTAASLGSSCRVALFGRDHGHADEYGHFDLLVGRQARAEVFPVVERWLAEHD